MNYKYQYPYRLGLPIIQLIALEMEIPDQEYDDELYENTNSTIVELLSEKVEQSSFASSVHLYSTATKKYPYFEDPRLHSHPSQSHPSQSPASFQQPLESKTDKSNPDKQKVDLEKLISNSKLSAYVRNSAQSRIFQNFLDEANSDQVEQIIKALYDEIPDLITDQYANYMTQKLFQVCSPNQRIFILTKLYPQIPSLVRNKQGTHTIQAFISLLTLN